MQAVSNFWQLAVDFVWGLPLVLFICGASIYFFLRSRLIPYRGLRHAIDLLLGRYSNPDDPGEIKNLIHWPEAVETWMKADIEKYAEEAGK